MIISKSAQTIIRVLLNNREKKFKLRQLAAEAGLSLGMTAKLVSALESAGQVTKTLKGIQVKDWKRLLFGWANLASVKEIEKIEFTAAERPQYLIKKITNFAAKQKLEYAFTLFSATELVAPYVAPSQTHLYILKDQKDAWEHNLPKINIFPAEKGNIVCFLVDKNYFYGLKAIRGTKIISLPQLYVDLYSLGGRGADAAQQLLKVMEHV